MGRRVKKGAVDAGVAQGTLARQGKGALLGSEAPRDPEEDLETPLPGILLNFLRT